MGKIQIEICLISARGLRVGTGIGSSLLKQQWYAVGWIDQEDKYCTTIDASRSNNPLWRRKFATLLDDDDSKSSSVSLHVEVYSREPIFLRKKLHGSATVSLKEFVSKYKKQSSSISVIEETGSYQLRKINSCKPRGFVDVSIRLSSQGEDLGGFTGDFGGVMLSNNSDYNTPGQNYMPGSSSQHPFAPLNNSNPFSILKYNSHSSIPNYFPMNNTNPQMQQPYYPPPMPPPPPPPQPLNTGYMPTYMQRSENVTNIASSSGGGGYARPGQGFSAANMGAGGIIGAAAAYYGSEFMSGGFDLPSSLPLPSIPISIDPPY
ncbi:unnamed protein product [Cochlearia groenlandica]